MYYVGALLVGILCIVMGILNRKGNLTTLHSYHRLRVKEEDRIPFGKMVGLGTILAGVGISLMGALAILSEMTNVYLFESLGEIVGAAVLLVGLGIALYAIAKYNKGLF